MINFRTARIMRRLLVAFGQIVACLAGIVLLICVMIIIQGRRDETRPAGVALVIDAGRGPEDSAALAELDYAVGLQRKGIIEHIIVPGGSQAAESQRYLVGRGAPAERIVVAEPAPSLRERLAHTGAAARALGSRSILIIAPPSSMLRVLKMTRDQGMDTYGVPANLPIRGRTYLDIARDTLREAWAYLGYIMGF